jgi:hypothetical protein
VELQAFRRRLSAQTRARAILHSKANTMIETKDVWPCHHCGREHPTANNPCHDAILKTVEDMARKPKVECLKAEPFTLEELESMLTSNDYSGYQIDNGVNSRFMSYTLRKEYHATLASWRRKVTILKKELKNKTSCKP